MVNQEISGPKERFEFGENWASYARLLNEKACQAAAEGILRLLPGDALKGCSFLDIGCGSGIHAVAAARLGAKKILAIDVDTKSVATARSVLSRFAPQANWEVLQENVLEARPEHFGTFDVVYAWGVLHHTGAMREALKGSAAFVAADGLFVFALYRKTRLDWFWTWEKRCYAEMPPWLQAAVRHAYVLFLRAAFAISGKDFRTHVDGYGERGMDFAHDVHDWLGGYPYETIAPDEVEALMTAIGFEKLRAFTKAYSFGLFGSGNNEYVYRRIS